MFSEKALLVRHLALLAATVLVATAAIHVAPRARADAIVDTSRQPLMQRPEVREFAADVAARRGLDLPWVESTLEQAIFLPNVPALMLPPTDPGAKDWRAYRKRFVNPARVRGGVRFWQRNREALERAEAEFGVPAEIIAGIIGVETVYGRNTGNFRVLDALTTLAFDFPGEHPRAAARQAYFRQELEQFLVLAQRGEIDAFDAQGSYAGAMGIPQFMPTSWSRYAVDFDGDGRIDLWGSETDAIGSVANYFKGHGWQRGQPTHYTVRLAPDADLQALLARDIEPAFKPTEFKALGGALDDVASSHEGELALVELPNGDPSLPGHAPSYVAGTRNFYVVTRYNHSAFYAMAVIELGRQIAEAMGQAQ